MRQGDYFQTSLFFEKARYEVKVSGRYISLALSMSYSKSKVYKTLG